MRTALAVTAALTAVVLAACGTAAPSAGNRATTGTGSTPTSPAPAPSATTIAPNMILAATSLPAGPFRITPLFCGKLSASQQNQFGTSAAGGLVYRFVNNSQSVTGSPDLGVSFLSGSAVQGTNYSGSQTQAGPGQSAEGEVDALDSGGNDITFTACELTGYSVATSSGFGNGGTYAP